MKNPVFILISSEADCIKMSRLLQTVGSFKENRDYIVFSDKKALEPTIIATQGKLLVIYTPHEKLMEENLSWLSSLRSSERSVVVMPFNMFNDLKHLIETWHNKPV